MSTRSAFLFAVFYICSMVHLAEETIMATNNPPSFPGNIIQASVLLSTDVLLGSATKHLITMNATLTNGSIVTVQAAPKLMNITIAWRTELTPLLRQRMHHFERGSFGKDVGILYNGSRGCVETSFSLKDTEQYPAMDLLDFLLECARCARTMKSFFNRRQYGLY